MGKKKKKKRLNILKFIRALLVLALLIVLVIFAVKTISGMTKGMSFGEAAACAVDELSGGLLSRAADKGLLNQSDGKNNNADNNGGATNAQDSNQIGGGTNAQGSSQNGSDSSGQSVNENQGGQSGATNSGWPNTTTTEDMYPLTTTDDDILVLVNKTHPMTSSYVANDFVTVEHCDPDVGNKETRKMRKVAADAFEELYAAAQDAGYTILMRTGYRSYEYQTTLYNNYVSKNGEAKANTYSAKPGQSEHQTGLCCDVGRPGKGLTTFDGTDEAKWVAENAWKYGFIVRFPEGKTDITGYIYESWHIRYVGIDAAKLIYEHNWTLEEYLEAAAKQQQ